MVNSNVTGVISLVNDLTGKTSDLYFDESGGLRSSTGYVGFPSEGIGIDTNGNNSRIYFMDASKTRRAGFSYELSDSSFVLYKFTASGTLGYSVAFPTTGGTLALQGTSGVEFKRNVKDADLNEAVDRIDALRMVNFVYKDDEQERQRFGIIADEAELVAPQYIKHNKEIIDIESGETRDRPSIDNNPIVMDLLGYVKYLKAEIETLKTALKG
ncbi:TPA: tail fiber domain-containing protein [Citrobacter amalonaticus]|nr:tail fiber domain-containing protein [Citrobacter amalonaticus]